MGQPEVGWGGVYPNPIGLPQRFRIPITTAVAGNAKFVVYQAMYT